jgi:hypothetical protein
LASFFDSLSQLAPVAPPSIFDLLFGCTLIVGGRDHGKCAVDTNQDHGSDFNGGSPVPVHLAHALKDLIRAMDKPTPLESIPFANERIDDIDFDGGVVLDVLDRFAATGYRRTSDDRRPKRQLFL